MEKDQRTCQRTEQSRESLKGKRRLAINLTNNSFRFYPSKVKAIVQSVIEGMLSEKEYEHAHAKHWAEQIVDTIRA